jgi:predicted metal-dependent HD superfamily phosphohydrolase
MASSQLLIQVEKYIKDLLSIELQGRPYHNFNHTAQVAKKCDELASYYGLSELDREALLTAAWFHDTGYLHGGMNHEEESTKIALNFLNELNISVEFIMKVNTLILATKLPARPTTFLQEILCDADLYHLASADYSKWSDRLRQEIQIQRGSPIAEKAWIQENITFYKTHHYFTEYANTFWESQKQLNFQTLIELSVRR